MKWFVFLSRDRMCCAYTMDAIASTAFGMQVDSHGDPNNAFVRNSKQFFDFSLTSPRAIILSTRDDGEIMLLLLFFERFILISHIDNISKCCLTLKAMKPCYSCISHCHSAWQQTAYSNVCDALVRDAFLQTSWRAPMTRSVSVSNIWRGATWQAFMVKSSMDTL